jgi:peptide/nickel transport system permease protein
MLARRRNKLLKFVARRLAVGLVSLVVFSFVMFWLVESLIPGDYFSMSRLTMTEAEVAALREAFGVDRPIPVRWWRWINSFVDGGLGQTTTGARVGTLLGPVIASTVFVFVTGLVIAYVVGQWLGRSTGWRRGLRSDGITLAGISLSTLFPPFVGFVLTVVLALRLRRWRAAVFEEQRREMWLDAPLSQGQYLNRMTVGVALGMVCAALIGAVWWRLRRNRITPGAQFLVALLVVVGFWQAIGITPFALDLLFEASLPLLAFVVLGFGEFMLIMQAGMVGQLNEDYVGTARAKGLRERTIRDRHASKNASLALVARLAVSVPYLMTGLVIIERAVSWPGIGTMLFSAIERQDLPTVISLLMVIGILTMLTRLVLEIITYTLDPRIAHPVGVQT